MRNILSVIIATLLFTPSAFTLDKMCDVAFEDCRTPLLQLIRQETEGVDVAFWFMQDSRYSAELIRRHRAGVKVRVLTDVRSFSKFPLSEYIVNKMRDEGIPIRYKVADDILHYKMMLFSGQKIVQFGAANYNSAFVPYEPYTNYMAETIYFTDDSAVVNSFRTKYDDLWTNTSLFKSYANVSSPTRQYAKFPLDPSMNFAPQESFIKRLSGRLALESRQIDISIYRLTDLTVTDTILAALGRGVKVRIVTEPETYRSLDRRLHSYNIDRLLMAGAEIKHRAHQGLNHQKIAILHSMRESIFGSSNWTAGPSDEHNYFTTKSEIFDFLIHEFERRWNSPIESKPFVPLAPSTPKLALPTHDSSNLSTKPTLTWQGGAWAHRYDIYLGTSSNPPLYKSNLEFSPNSVKDGVFETFTLTEALLPGTKYYWRIVSRTMANITGKSSIWSFTTSGSAPSPVVSAPPPVVAPAAKEIVLYAAKAAFTQGSWTKVLDTLAASGYRMFQPDAGVGKISTAAVSPTHYFELSFYAVEGVPYRLWIRGKAWANSTANDSVFVQFTGSVDINKQPVFRIGSTSATPLSIQDGNGAVLKDYGWADNGYGAEVGPLIRFATTGWQKVRIQAREDGISVDQIVLSPQKYLSVSPGLVRSDALILAESLGN